MADTPAKKAAASSDADKSDTTLTSTQKAGAVDLGPLVARDDDTSAEELTWAEQAYPELTPEEQEALEKAHQASIDEYSQFEAVQPVEFGGARAHNVGDRVPASNVRKYGLLDRGLVKKIGD
jgi:hypothetical protein